MSVLVRSSGKGGLSRGAGVAQSPDRERGSGSGHAPPVAGPSVGPPAAYSGGGEAERQGQDGDLGGSPAHLLPVDVEAGRRLAAGRGDPDRPGPVHLHHGEAEVGAPEEPGHGAQGSEAGDVADHDDVQEAVGGVGVGGDPHPAAEAAPVGDHHLLHAPPRGLPVDGEHHVAVAVGHQLADRDRPGRRPSRAARPASRRSRFTRVHHLAADAAVGDVDEEAVGPVGEVDPAEVDGPGGAAGQQPGCGAGVGGQVEGAPEVAAGAARDQADGEVRGRAGRPPRRSSR